MAFLVPVRIEQPEVLIVACLAAFVTFLAYQPAVLVVIPLVTMLLLRFFWRGYQSTNSHKLLLLLILVVELIAYFTYRPIYERLVLRVGTSGEIWPTDTKFTFLVSFVSGILILVSRGNFRRTVVASFTLGISALCSLELIDFARGSDPDLYYLIKFRYATNFVSGIICIAIIAAIWNRLNSSKSLLRMGSRVLRSVVVLGLVGGLFASITNCTQAPSPVSLIRTGWDAPSVSVAKKTFELWTEGTPYIFSGYFNEGNDRIANFWSPYFWEPNRWEWTYGGYSISAQGLCNVIRTNEVNVYTRTFGLESQIASICPSALKSAKVFSPENQTYDFSDQLMR